MKRRESTDRRACISAQIGLNCTQDLRRTKILISTRAFRHRVLTRFAASRLRVWLLLTPPGPRQHPLNSPFSPPASPAQRPLAPH
eukprot:1842189-Pleurochrysis_carterae.AAC.1